MGMESWSGGMRKLRHGNLSAPGGGTLVWAWAGGRGRDLRPLLEPGQEPQLSQPRGGRGGDAESGAFSVAQLVRAAERGGRSCS